MSHYAPLLGKKVEAHYRASDLNLLAVGTLVADTGSSIFIEDRFTQNGREKKMRLEIPITGRRKRFASKFGPRRSCDRRRLGIAGAEPDHSPRSSRDRCPWQALAKSPRGTPAYQCSKVVLAAFVRYDLLVFDHHAVPFSFRRWR